MQFNANDYNSVHLNTIQRILKSIEYAYALDSALSTMNPRKNQYSSMQLNAVQYSSMQMRTKFYEHVTSIIVIFIDSDALLTSFIRREPWKTAMKNVINVLLQNRYFYGLRCVVGLICPKDTMNNCCVRWFEPRI